MPLLTSDELSGIIGAAWSKGITRDAGAFEQAERNAANMISARTGISIVDLAGDTTGWYKTPCAHLILYNLQGNLSGLTDAQRELFQSWRNAALDECKAHKKSAPVGMTGAQTGQMEGMVE